MARVAFRRGGRVLPHHDGKSPTRGDMAGFVRDALAQARQTALRMAFHSSSFDQKRPPWRFMSFFALLQIGRQTAGNKIIAFCHLRE